jgi:hypothetical protein
MIMSTPQEHFDAARRFQEYYDNTLRRVGMRAPQPVLGESVNDYRRKVLLMAKKTFLPRSHELRQFSLDDVKADALQVLEPRFLEAFVTEAHNPAHVPPGELRKLERLDEYGKVKTIDFIGQESFVKQMARPGKRMAIHDPRTREWYPMSPEEWRRRNYDATRR